MPIDISYEVHGRTYTGYLADGSNGKPAPGILVIHEANGLGPHMKERADMLARLGYVAFAPDLYGEKVDALDRMLALVDELTEDWTEMRARCNAGLDVLRQQSNVDKTRIAAIGFCFGGQVALELGRSGADLRAIVGFHLALKTLRLEDSANIKARVLVCIGDQDPYAPRDDRNSFMDNMRENNVDCQMLLFSGIGHSFANVDSDKSQMAGVWYDAKADRRSWAAMTRLLSEAFDEEAGV
jgi:dienelactone hydrolase